MSADLTLKECQKEWHGTFRAYVIGFFASLLLTTLSFSLVALKAFSGQLMIYILIALALTQAIVQLLFFLHLGQEAKPSWESLVFYFMVLVLLIIAVGSLWIMHDLGERVMPERMEEMSHD